MPLALPRFRFRRCGDRPRPLRGGGRRWPLLLSLGLIGVAVLGCRPGPGPRPQVPPTRSSAEALRQQRQQRQLAVRQCQQRRQLLRQDLAELRRSEAALARERAAVPPLLPAPPVWDEAAEQRYSRVDQELDRQRYEQELAAWQRRRDDRAAELARQRQRQDAAQQRLDRQALQLQQRYPGLFTGPTSIEVKPQELERLSRCPDASA